MSSLPPSARRIKSLPLFKAMPGWSKTKAQKDSRPSTLPDPFYPITSQTSTSLPCRYLTCPVAALKITSATSTRKINKNFGSCNYIWVIARLDPHFLLLPPIKKEFVKFLNPRYISGYGKEFRNHVDSPYIQSLVGMYENF